MGKLTIEVKKDKDGLWVLCCERLNAVGVGEDLPEAFCDLGMSVMLTIDGYMDEDDANLTESARKLKRALKEVFGDAR